MKLAKRWGLMLAVGCFLGAQAPTDDPVMKARLQRSQAQGIDEADLPPVPRTVTEPPPLPPPETHAKDLPHAAVSKAARRRGGSVRPGKRGRAALPRETRAAGRRAAPARPARQAPAARKARPAGAVARKPGRRARK